MFPKSGPENFNGVAFQDTDLYMPFSFFASERSNAGFLLLFFLLPLSLLLSSPM